MKGKKTQMDFTDGDYLTAKEKAKIFSQWKRFLESGFELAYFKDALYKHLHLHCEFIAHYGRVTTNTTSERYAGSGFYNTYFGIGAESAGLEFIVQFDPVANPMGVSFEYGRSDWLQGDCADLNQAMRTEMTSHAMKLAGMLRTRAHTRKVNELEALAAQLGYSVVKEK